MAMCSFADQFSMFDVTPLENLFIEEYMLRAPGDYVKVYIYGLRLCYHPVKDASVTSIARALGLEEKTVMDAFAYWERMHVLRRTGDTPPSYCYYNLKEAKLSGRGSDGDVPLADRQFNIALQELFQERILQAQDYDRTYRWMDDMHFKPEVVLMLVKYCIDHSGRGVKVAFSTIEKEAVRWAKAGATTLDAAEEHLRTLSVQYEGAQRVLRHMGLNRAPTVDEERLYAKWAQEWGFSLDAILYACSETTKISKPNFAYVDKVLENMYKKQLGTSADMAAAQKSRSDAMRPVREVLEALGEKSVAPTEDLAVLYAGWLGMGFTHEAILMAARQAMRRGKHTMEDVGVLLQAWAKQALYTPEAIEAYLTRRRQNVQRLRTLFEVAGISREPTTADIRLMENWRAQGYELEVLTIAAESARGAGNPMLYISRVVDNWAAKGIVTPEAARAEHEKWVEGLRQRPAESAADPSAAEQSAPRPSKEVGAHRFGQRSYTDEELAELLYTDLDELNS